MQLGLKLWSVNTGRYLTETRRLYDCGLFDYLELYTVPGTLNTLQQWQSLNLPVVIHAPHFKHGFNLAKREHRESNRRLYEEVRNFADTLNARYIIFHGGTFGNINETAQQLADLNEPRALIENKPCITQDRGTILNCRGASPEEIRCVIQSSGCGFCLDIPHAICAANYRQEDQMKLLQEFNTLNPAMYHLADMMDTTQHIDDHTQLGLGALDMNQFIPGILGHEAMVTIETTRRIENSLQEFEREVNWFQRLYQRV